MRTPQKSCSDSHGGEPKNSSHKGFFFFFKSFFKYHVVFQDQPQANIRKDDILDMILENCFFPFL